jgi:uncharacterized damage-inducible protein DinB
VIATIKDFDRHWTEEFDKTQKIFKHLTDRSLTQLVAPGGRTLGRLAWHITTTIPEMMSRTGLTLAGPGQDAPVPTWASAISGAYQQVALSLLDQIKANWTDETLMMTDEMYGQIWKRGYTLTALIFHQIHHRGQITVLMRQAGLKVPGIYGPAREEWAVWGMPEPEV